MAEPTSVLVVDDNEDLVDTFSLILKRRGFNVDTATNGAEAVKKSKGKKFDVILMDVVMPQMNGVEAFRQIKQESPKARVILMTAYSEADLIDAALREGVISVIHKPVRVDQLIEMIKEVASNPVIMVVDDDADVRHTLMRALELEGYRVMAAGSGEEAVSLLKEKRCQIAFLDIKLPNIDGLETYLRLKEIEPDLEAIMITGYRDEVKDALDKAMASSAIRCLYKPFNPIEAIILADKLCAKRV